MPAPKRPNTGAATAAVIRKAQERKAAELRAAGWTVYPPGGEDQNSDGHVQRVDLPGVVDVADQWYGVTDGGRALHIVVGEVRFGVRALCGQRVEREAVPLDGNRLCRQCDRLAPRSVSTTS